MSLILIVLQNIEKTLVSQYDSWAYSLLEVGWAEWHIAYLTFQMPGFVSKKFHKILAAWDPMAHVFPGSRSENRYTTGSKIYEYEYFIPKQFKLKYFKSNQSRNHSYHAVFTQYS
jgi:hypothetical protein